MIFYRKEKKYEFVLPLIVILLSILCAYLCYDRILSWSKWILIIIASLIGFSAYKSLKNVYRKIVKIEFISNEVKLYYKNGEEDILQGESFGYALEIKRYINPVRSIQIKTEKKKRFGKVKRKNLGVLKFSNWSDLESLAAYLVKNKYQRSNFSFEFGFFEVLMIIPLLLIGASAAEDATFSFIEDVEGGNLETQPDIISKDLIRTSSDIVEIAVDEKERIRENNEKSKKRWLDKFRSNDEK